MLKMVQKGQGNQMYEDGWSRFMQTGQVYDYLAYKGHPEMEKAESKAGETHERGDTKFYYTDRDYYKSRTDRRI
ncbi:MAG: hypothetical protein J6D08_00800 [Lachnospiraceae bacterium]|nr:hypothetical protein [Lachnospiraceae bacterium]